MSTAGLVVAASLLPAVDDLIDVVVRLLIVELLHIEHTRYVVLEGGSGGLALHVVELDVLEVLQRDKGVEKLRDEVEIS